MAKIKKGTYRFNDVIVNSPRIEEGDDFHNTYLQQDLQFTVTLVSDYGRFVASCAGITTDDHYIDGVEVYYNVQSLEPSLPTVNVPDESFTVYRDEWYVFYGEGIQTITILEDTDTSDEFGVWFTSNTKAVVPTADSVKAKIENLIARANATTGKSDADLTSGVASLCEGYGQGGAEFNIAFGDTEPTDTTKLWVKANKPNSVNVTSALVVGSEEIEYGVSNLLFANYAIGSASVGTKIYLFGGNVSKSIYVFDTESNKIEQLAPQLPHQSESIVAIAVGTKIYLFAGYASSTYYKDISIFDTEKRSVITLSTALPKKVDLIGGAAVGTKIYLFGGDGEGTKLSTINVFDTENNSILTIDTQLPVAMDTITVASVGTKIYLFGGRDANGRVSTINVFDTENYTISTLSTTLPVPSYRMAVASIGTKIYLFGGYGTDVTYLSTINVFDTENYTISTLSTTLPVGADRKSASAVGTKIYLFGGYCPSGKLSTIDVFTVKKTLETNKCLVEASAKENFFDLLPNVKLGVKDVYLGNSEGYAEKVDAALYKNGAWTEI